MELFHENGHLTDDALQALLHETLDELERLEVAEHLAFCDDCIINYTALLTEDTLLTPSTPVALTAWQRIRQKIRQSLVSRYISAAACAALALVLWSSGIFNLDIKTFSENTLTTVNETTQMISSSTSGWTQDRIADIQNIFAKEEGTEKNEHKEK